MSPGFIVDGYNLLHCFPGLGRMADQDLERARDALVSRLAVFRGRKRIRVVVVFDGGAEGEPVRFQSRGIEIIFARQQSADARIVKMVRALKHPKAWTVVSSDRWVKEHAGTYGVKAMNSSAFVELVPVGSGPGAGSEPDKPEMKPGDVPEWEEYFRKGKRCR